MKLLVVNRQSSVVEGGAAAVLPLLRRGGGESRSVPLLTVPSSLTPDPRLLTPLRHGISLTEVLISMGLLAIGLLGVAAMFPVGSFYMLQGEISDRSAAGAKAAFSDMVNRGMLQPEAWMMGTASTYWNESLPQRYSNATPAQRATFPHSTWGSVYVIDPLGVMNHPATLQAPMLAQMPIANSYNFSCLTTNSPSWQPWNNTGKRYPIRRVSLSQMVPMGDLDLNARATLVAEQLFYNQDDLAIELPEQSDLPGQIRSEVSGLARSYDGHYSWLATIAPTSYVATQGLWSGNPGTSMYDVSVAVFHRRPLGEMAAERHVKAAVLTSGTSGGQLLLTRFPPGVQDTSNNTPFEHLKVGQYVTLYGPHPKGSNEQPFLFFQWYKVIAVEGEDQHLNVLSMPTNNTSETDRRIVTLRGPDWPWQPEPSNDLANAEYLSNDLRVGIYAGAVAVHTKTMRLAGGSNSGSPWAAPSTVSPGSPRRWVAF